MSELRQRFGRLVAAHRKRARLTQGQLAEAAGISIDMISRIESGATGARFGTIEKLAQALEVDPAQLFSAEMASSAMQRVALSALTARLAGLSDDDLRWISGILDAALKRR